MAKTNTIQFSDINLDFVPHPVTGDVVKLTNANAVKRAVRNLVLSNMYEHPYDKNKGSDIRRLLFENAGPEIQELVEQRVEFVVTMYEPRVELISVSANMDYDRNGLDVTIKFFVGSASTPDEVSIFLERVR